ncbi:uncharacterized protein LOC128876597 [Hylaeus volcanicus]|uniref:uncharacterized protein LOC128876597 n=1 Tax=Hylaeus volcanicus TaxID=313075 RepID=UPI0023B7BA3C|nr:uncharacterized protein LOC128876597 [Hylaeus volcanicus]
MITNFGKIEHLNRRQTWRPLHASDFESLMYPNFCISFILGLFPYKYESSRYVISRARFLWCTFTVLVLVAFVSITLYQINFGTLMHLHAPGAIHGNVHVFLGGGTIVVSYILTKRRLRVLRNLVRTSQILTPKEFNDLAKLFHTKDILGFLFLVVHFPNCFKETTYDTARQFSVLYIVLTTLSLDMFYMNCVCILRACFGKINEGLRQLNAPTTNNEFNAETRKKALRNEQKSTLLLTRLKNLEETHLRTSDAVRLINQTFFIHTAILTTITFSVVTFNLYFFYLWVNGVSTVEVATNFWYLKFLSSVFFYTIKFTMLVWACETTKNQAVEIGATIHDALSSTTDALVKHELQLFSFQVLHQDNTFSARIVTLNAALLTQMAGGVVMYILILFQFLMNSIHCKTYI